MRILHFYPESDRMIAQYVNMLCDTMGEHAETSTACNLLSVRKELRRQRPDILHLHGCWTLAAAIASRLARKNGVRTVLTPHGQLEQWIIKQRYWKEKLPKIILYQKETVRRAYSVIAMGRMEESGLKRLNWNRRIETVRNPLITESISKQDACALILKTYRKVLDTDVLNVMNKSTARAIEPLIKAGLTGNHQWLDDREYNALVNHDDIDWRKILVYSHQENILQTVRHGMETLFLPVPDIPLAEVPCYYPDGFTAPSPLSDTIEDGKSDADKRIVAMIRLIRKHASRKKLSISHIVELSAELRRCDINDDKVAEMLEEQRLDKFARRLMQILNEMTGLDEGFMPVAARNDKKTQKIRTIINKHLEI